MVKRILLFVFLIALFTSASWARDTVTMVQLDPMSGPFKDVGDLSIAGVQFLVDEVNAAGGLLGKKIKYMPEDSQLKPDVAVRKATKAIMEDNAKIILQLSSTAVSRALMDVAEKNKVIFVTLGRARTPRIRASQSIIRPRKNGILVNRL